MKLIALCCLALVVPQLAAQQPLRPIIGVIRRIADSLPVADVEITIGTRRTTSNAEGRFRIDSMAPGRYPVQIRRIGFRPVHSRIAVVASEPTEVEYYLFAAAVMLETIVVNADRSAIYGKVGDTAFRALPGATVSLLGKSGNTVLADSLGGFEFPRLPDGTYLVRVTKPGYTERRISVDISGGKGRELTFLLSPEQRRRFEPGAAAALWDLGRRLALRFRRERMAGSELDRYGSMSVCDVPRVRSVIGKNEVGVLNGVTDLLPGQICAWRMDEIEIIEFFEGTTQRRAGGPVRGPGSVIIWEKR